MGLGRHSYHLVVLGASRGGTKAMSYLLSALPADFRFPIAMVIHRDPTSDVPLRDILQNQSLLPVLEAEDKMAIEPGHVYLAPANYHLLVGGPEFSLSTEGPVLCARPSIDVLFESAGNTHGRATIAILLTGASSDGALGSASIRGRGGYVIVQDPASAESATMPQAAITAAAQSIVLPLAQIPGCLSKLAEVMDE